MSRLLALPLAAALAGLSAARQPDNPPPKAGPLLTTGRVEGNNLVYTQVFPKAVVRERPMVYTDGAGKTFQKMIQVLEAETVAFTASAPLAEFRATDTAGKVIPSEQLAAMLKTDSVIVVSRDGPIAPEYRKAFKDGTVFFGTPAKKAKKDKDK